MWAHGLVVAGTGQGAEAGGSAPGSPHGAPLPPAGVGAAAGAVPAAAAPAAARPPAAPPLVLVVDDPRVQGLTVKLLRDDKGWWVVGREEGRRDS